MNDPPSPDEARDEAQLRALRIARANDDVSGQRDAMRLLIGPYWEWAYAIVFGRIASSTNRERDAEDVAAAVISRLLGALKTKTDFGKPFWKVALDNLQWELFDYYKARTKNESSAEEPEEIARLRELADTDEAPLPTWIQLDDFRSYLDVLNDLDRELITERIFFEMKPAQIAAKHDMKPDKVHRRLHRALTKLRQSPALDDVRNRYEDTA